MVSIARKKGTGQFRLSKRWVILLIVICLLPGLILAEEEAIVLPEAEGMLEAPLYSILAPFKVNLVNGNYILTAAMQLVFIDPLPKAWLDARIPLVHDVIVSHLSALHSKQLNDSRSRFLLKQDLLAKLNSLFPNNRKWDDPKPIKKILFEEFYYE